MTTPDWALTMAYWVHMAATVVWIGALSSLTFWVLPVGRVIIPPQFYRAYLENMRRWMDPIAWLCLLLLVATGLVQIGAHPRYQGFLAIEDRWSIAILLKHILFLVMVGVSAVLTWFVFPELRRIALRWFQAPEDSSWDKVHQREIRLVRLNLLLSVLILGLTAVARVS